MDAIIQVSVILVTVAVLKNQSELVLHYAYMAVHFLWDILVSVIEVTSNHSD